MRAIFQACLSPLVVLGSVGLAILIVGSVLLLAVLSRPLPTTQAVSTAALTVIPAPSATVAGVPAPTATPEVPEEIPPSPVPGEISSQATVQISGTSGEGLNLRESPGLESNILYLGLEAEVFVVQDGPRDADGLTWWYLEGFYDASRRGWAAANYLSVIQNP